MISLWNVAIFLTVFIIDRASKAFILLLGEQSYRITSILSFEISYNRGISWGMFNHENTLYFIGISCFVGAFIMWFAWYTKTAFDKKQQLVGHMMVLGGALSNLLDRCLYGGVIDFIYFSYGGWSWPSFNCADACIVVGVMIMIAQEMYYEQTSII